MNGNLHHDTGNGNPPSARDIFAGLEVEFDEDNSYQITSIDGRRERKALSDSAAALAALAAEAGMPDSVERTIWRFIGISQGRGEVRINQRRLGIALCRKGEGVKRAALAKRAQRAVAEMVTWEESSGYTLVQVLPGGRDYAHGDAPVSTVYRIKAHEIVEQVLHTARRGQDWAGNRQGALRRAARKVLSSLKPLPPKIDEFRRPHRNPESAATQRRNTLLTLFRKVLEEAQAHGGDPLAVADGIFADERRILTELSDGPQSPDPAAAVLYPDWGNRTPGEHRAGSTPTPPCDPPAPERQDAPAAPPCAPPLGDLSDSFPESPEGGGVVDTFVHYPPPQIQSVQEDIFAQRCEITDISSAVEVAREAAYAFASVGVRRVEYGFRDDATGQVFDYQREVRLSDFLGRLADVLAESDRLRRSLAGRVRGAGWQEEILQVDDCSAEVVERLRPYCFLVIETSPGNFQCWLALMSEAPEHCPEIHRRLKVALAGTGANGGAHGAVRWPGSANWKPGREGFRVRVIEINHGRSVSEAELEEARLLVEPVSQPVIGVKTAEASGELPDYVGSTHDRSRADYWFACEGARRGVQVEETAEAMCGLKGSKAEKRGMCYALTTAKRAAAEVARQRGRAC